MKYQLTFFLLLFCFLGNAQETALDIDKFKGDIVENIMLSSDAKIKKNKVQLTPAQANRRGGLWFSDEKMFVADTFELSFCFKIYKNGGKGPSGEGGEGIALVMHNNEIPGKNGQKKAGMGYAGIENSIAVEFDAQDTEDMGKQHVSIQTNGIEANASDKGASYAAMTLDTDIKDGETHFATIQYNSPEFIIFLDGVQVLKCEMDITEILNLDEGKAWVGITAATGKTYSIHEISCFTMATKKPYIPYVAMEGGREVKRTKRIVVHSKHIRIRLWDINQEDGDIVSINLNGEWVVKDHVLTNEGEYFDFTLEGQMSYLVLHAHNLGEIPPNTAGITVSDGVGGDKEYTLRSNLYLSDALLVEYHKTDNKDLEVTRKSGKGKPDMKVD